MLEPTKARRLDMLMRIDSLTCNEALQERDTLLDELDMPLNLARRLADEGELGDEQVARLRRIEELVWFLCD